MRVTSLVRTLAAAGSSFALLAPLGGCKHAARVRSENPWTLLEARAKDGSARPEELVRLGEYQLAQDKILEAFELGLRARKAAPEFVGGHHLLGLIYQRTEQFPKARASFRKVLELDPSLTAARLNLARIELTVRRPVAALEVLQQAVRDAPQNAEVWLLVGQAQHQRSSPDRAAASLRRAVELDPNLADAHAALGSLHLDLGEYQQAIAPLEKAYALGARSPLTLINLATALVAGRGGPADLQRAESLLAEANNPNLPAAQLAQGLIQQQNGNMAQAAEAYEAVLATVPRHERALYGLAECQRALGQREKSAATLKQYDSIVKLRQRLRTIQDRLKQEGEKPSLLREYATGLYQAEQYAQAAVYFLTWAAKAPNDPEPREWLRRIQERGIPLEAPQ